MTAETAQRRRELDAALAAIRDQGERLDALLAEAQTYVAEMKVEVRPW